MSKTKQWTYEEGQIVKEMLDQHKTYEEISKRIGRTITGIKIAISRKLDYQWKCIDCNKPIVAASKRCPECAFIYNKENKKVNEENNRAYYRKLRTEKRFGGNRETALIRDLYTCQMCGKTHHETILDVHHIDKKGRNSKTPNNELSNLITYCHSCHTKQHKEDTIMKRWHPSKKEE